MPDKSGFFYVTEQVARYAIQAQPQSKQKQDTLHEPVNNKQNAR